MKNYKRIMYSVGVLGLICFILTAYFSGIRERQERMQETMGALKDASSQYIQDKFNELDIPYTSHRSSGRSERTTRVCVSEKGRYEVKIDSLKESRGLYDLVDVGSKLECLMLEHLFSLDEMFAAWKNETEKLGYTMSCALKLTVSDMYSSDKMIFVAGDSTLIQGKYDKGLYYMDAFYLMELHPYIKPPLLVTCIRWDLCLLVVLVVSLILLVLYRLEIRSKKHKLGMYCLDEIKERIYQGNQEIKCSPREFAFLRALLLNERNEVSFDEINRICGWSADEHGLDGRRRKFISNIRQLLKDDETLVIRSLVDVKVDAYKLEYSK